MKLHTRFVKDASWSVMRGHLVPVSVSGFAPPTHLECCSPHIYTTMPLEHYIAFVDTPVAWPHNDDKPSFVNPTNGGTQDRDGPRNGKNAKSKLLELKLLLILQLLACY